MKVSKLGQATLMCVLLATFAATAHAAGSKGLAYVSNQEDGVSVIDLNTLQPVATIDTQSKSPRGIGVTADGTLLITANRDSGDVSVIERATRKVIRHIRIGKNPEFVRVRGDRAYVTFEPSAKAGPPPRPPGKEQTNDKANQAPAKGSAGGAKDDDENHQPAQIAVVDLKRFKVLRRITGGMETEGIEFSPDGKWMLVTNEADNSITAHDLKTGKLLKTVSTEEFGNRPRGIKVSPDGQYYVVTLEFADKFLVLDSKLKPLKAVATGKSPYGVAFDRAGKRLFVAAGKEKKLQVFDAQSFEPIDEMALGDRCWHFSFTPDDSQILVACGRSNNLYVFDAQTYAPVKQIPGKSTPWGVVTYPKSAGSLDAP